MVASLLVPQNSASARFYSRHAVSDIDIGTSRNFGRTEAPTNFLNRETWVYVYLQVGRKSQ
jgi:hypothetical protein